MVMYTQSQIEETVMSAVEEYLGYTYEGRVHEYVFDEVPLAAYGLDDELIS